MCQVATEDSSDLHCRLIPNEATVSEVVDTTTPWPLLSIIVAAGLGGLLALFFVSLLIFCARHRHRHQTVAEKGTCRKTSLSTLIITERQMENERHRVLSSSRYGDVLEIQGVLDQSKSKFCRFCVALIRLVLSKPCKRNKAVEMMWGNCKHGQHLVADKENC